MNDLVSGLLESLHDIDNDALGVAVSGGGDSMALLHMLAERGAGLRAVTVDHGLRDESAAEAAMVAEACRNLGIPHTTIKWVGWDRSGNLQDEARRARIRLISGWASAQGISHIALGHTMDDQAETVLLRLARGSGVDGLSGMAARRLHGSVTWVRPLLHARRADLRTYLTTKRIDWIDDPSNEDPKYNRIKARQALDVLVSIGIEAKSLAATADRMRDARTALEYATAQLADECVAVSDVGEVRINATIFNAAPDEIRFRLLAASLQWISGAPYRPRFDSLRNLLGGALESGQTLHGCTIRSHAGNIVVRREPARVEAPCPIGDVWDHRWIVSVRGEGDADRIGALGENGLKLCANWRETGHAREALLASPAIWSNDTLVAAPLAGMANEWSIAIKEGKKGLHKSLITR